MDDDSDVPWIHVRRAGEREDDQGNDRYTDACEAKRWRRVRTTRVH
jgi:hypothetical protein